MNKENMKKTDEQKIKEEIKQTQDEEDTYLDLIDNEIKKRLRTNFNLLVKEAKIVINNIIRNSFVFKILFYFFKLKKHYYIY